MKISGHRRLIQLAGCKSAAGQIHQSGDLLATVEEAHRSRLNNLECNNKEYSGRQALPVVIALSSFHPTRSLPSLPSARHNQCHASLKCCLTCRLDNSNNKASMRLSQEALLPMVLTLWEQMLGQMLDNCTKPLVKVARRQQWFSTCHSTQCRGNDRLHPSKHDRQHQCILLPERLCQ